MEIVLKTNKVTKNFGRLKALQGVDLSIEREDILGIIGPNGAGKTTLFNVISGFLKASSGAVYLYDTNITNKSPHLLVRRGMARTFQIPKPFRNLTVSENLMVTQHRKSELDVDRLEYNDHILSLTGLWDKRDELSGNLPIGFLKCLEVARALSTRPSLLLLDEPFAGLNALEIEQLSKIIANRNFKEKLTVAIIEHKLKELMKLVSRVVVLQHGEVIAQGTPSEVARDRNVLKAYIGARTAKILQGNK